MIFAAEWVSVNLLITYALQGFIVILFERKKKKEIYLDVRIDVYLCPPKIRTFVPQILFFMCGSGFISIVVFKDTILGYLLFVVFFST